MAKVNTGIVTEIRQFQKDCRMITMDVNDISWQYGDFEISPCKEGTGEPPVGTDISLVECSVMSDREFNIIVRIDRMGTDDGTWICHATVTPDDFPQEWCAEEPIWKHGPCNQKTSILCNF